MTIREKAEIVYRDYEFRSFLFFGISIFITFLFTVYNLIFGLYYHVQWSISICIYYMVLLGLKSLIIVQEKAWRYEDEQAHRLHRIQLFRLVSKMMLFMDLTLVVPITLMVFLQRPVSIGKIPAIALAAYSTYKITFAIINFIRTRRNENLSLHALKIINLKDAIVSIHTLQNTLIMVFGYSISMSRLSAFTGMIMLLIMLGITISMIRKAYYLES